MDKEQLIKFGAMETNIDNIKESIDDLNSKLDKFIDSADKKFAPKWIQGFVWFILLAIVGGYISILINF